MAGVGLDAKIMNNTDPELKAKVGWLAYARALIAVLREKDSLRIQYHSEGRRGRRPMRAQAVIVGNCGSLPANILLLPEAVVDDGLLDLVILKPESFVGWLQLIFKVFWENGVVRRTRLGTKAPRHPHLVRRASLSSPSSRCASAGPASSSWTVTPSARRSDSPLAQSRVRCA